MRALILLLTIVTLTQAIPMYLTEDFAPSVKPKHTIKKRPAPAPAPKHDKKPAPHAPAPPPSKNPQALEKSGGTGHDINGDEIGHTYGTFFRGN